MMELIWVILAVLACGAAGSFVNVFIGDSGLHLPMKDQGVWRPGFIGTVFVGIIAALASWAMAKSAVLLGGNLQPVIFSTGDLANALVVGFGGAKWWKSETEKDVLQRTAAVAAGRQPNQAAANVIATSTPFEALNAAMQMQ